MPENIDSKGHESLVWAIPNIDVQKLDKYVEALLGLLIVILMKKMR